MGTLRLSALPNQMSCMQFSARGGGACAWLDVCANFENSISRTAGSGIVCGCKMTADRKAALDAATALSGEDCIWSDGGQQGFTAQHPAHVMAAHLPGIWQDAGIASSGCEAVATISSKITSAFFTRVRHILAPIIPGGELAAPSLDHRRLSSRCGRRGGFDERAEFCGTRSFAWFSPSRHRAFEIVTKRLQIR